MLRRDRQIRTQISQLADAILVAASFWCAFALRADPQIAAWLGLDPISSDTLNKDAALIPVAMVAAALLLESQGFYERPVFCPRRAILWPLFKGCALTTMVLILVTFLFQKDIVTSRSVMTFFGIISFALVYAKEELTRLAFKTKFAQLQYKRRFALVGTEDEITRMCGELVGRKDESVAVVAQFDIGVRPIPELIQLLHEHAINGVILSAKHAYFEQIENVITACELEGVEVWLLADFFATKISRTSFDDFFGRPLLIFRSAPETSWSGLVKQMMDFCGALGLLILVGSWLFPLIALAIKISSPGPVLFRQQRSGLNGAPFTLYKFRTMVTNAEQFKHELEAMNEMRGPVFKLTKDPRITRIGKFLRRYSLDELPQLWNVLRGEMSLVGPRPLPVDEVKRFNDLAHRRRLSVKPGLTCLWQVSGRNEIFDFKDWVRLDLEYIDHWSLWLDIKILLRTVPAVFLASGAK
jgi:exopolysaccharide biosynthesis polyprenyl glycosylphosphotransferase